MNKKTANDVLDRIIQAIGAENDTDAANLLGVARPTWGNWRSRNSVPYSLCVTLAQESGLSLDWLLLGKGPMRLGGQPYLMGKSNALNVMEHAPLHPREQKLLEEFRQLDEPLKAWLFGAMAEKIQLKNMQTEIDELKRNKLKE